MVTVPLVNWSSLLGLKLITASPVKVRSRLAPLGAGGSMINSRP